MFKIEPSEEDPPQAVDVMRDGVGVAVPQPRRLRVAVARQTLDGQVDEGAFHDRQVALVVAPPALTAFQFGVQPPPSSAQ
ncbi:hypothetical protein [Kitasatospora sp. NPDC001175]|uniref:hypothetical protein n=1 Tax=Kitasatospora sp. NPDC001175 TaxID=3157103 RepID=UPI003D06E7F5